MPSCCLSFAQVNLEESADQCSIENLDPCGCLCLLGVDPTLTLVANSSLMGNKRKMTRLPCSSGKQSISWLPSIGLANGGDFEARFATARSVSHVHSAHGQSWSRESSACKDENITKLSRRWEANRRCRTSAKPTVCEPALKVPTHRQSGAAGCVMPAIEALQTRICSTSSLPPRSTCFGSHSG